VPARFFDPTRIPVRMLRRVCRCFILIHSVGTAAPRVWATLTFGKRNGQLVPSALYATKRCPQLKLQAGSIPAALRPSRWHTALRDPACVKATVMCKSVSMAIVQKRTTRRATYRSYGEWGRGIGKSTRGGKSLSVGARPDLLARPRPLRHWGKLRGAGYGDAYIRRQSMHHTTKRPARSDPAGPFSFFSPKREYAFPRRRCFLGTAASSASLSSGSVSFARSFESLLDAGLGPFSPVKMSRACA